MGNCESINFCNNNFDVLSKKDTEMRHVDESELEDYQIHRITFNQLKDPYDKFYRRVADPFCKIQVRDLISTINDMHIIYGKIKHEDEQITIEQVPFLEFIDHFSKQDQWKNAILDQNSEFNKLIFIKNLFLINTEDINYKDDSFDKLFNEDRYKKDRIQNIQNGKDLSKYNIDLVNFKIFSFLMCIGTSAEKADYLFDLILGNQMNPLNSQRLEGKKLHRHKRQQQIEWKNPRLIQSIRKIVFFSEIFPKKYFSEFMVDQCKDVKSSKLDSYRSQKSTTWSDDYVSNAEQNFERIIEQMYEKEFIEKIFNDYECLISREAFIMAISSQIDPYQGIDLQLNPFDKDGINLDFGNIKGKQCECKWIFRPSKIRVIFKSYLLNQ